MMKRAIVSVAFERDDFRKLAHVAAESGKTVSSLIRAAALGVTESRAVWTGFTGDGLILMSDAIDGDRTHGDEPKALATVH